MDHEQAGSGAIRVMAGHDLPALRAVIDATGLFPSDMLDGMAAAFLRDPTSEFWLTCDDGAPVGVAYCAPERMTDGTWNALLIAVHPTHQGRGVGAALMAAVDRMVAARGGRIVLVETSGLPAFARTRAFYRRLGYTKEARIRDFYAAGEDKIVFRKALAQPQRIAGE